MQEKKGKICNPAKFVYPAWHSSKCFLSLCLPEASLVLLLFSVKFCSDAFGCVCGTKERESKYICFSADSSSSLFPNSAFQSIFLPLSLNVCSPPLVNVSFRFSAFPLINTAEDSFRIQDKSLRLLLRKTGAKKKRRGRLCLREGKTEIKVTNHSKSPAETESVREDKEM